MNEPQQTNILLPFSDKRCDTWMVLIFRFYLTQPHSVWYRSRERDLDRLSNHRNQLFLPNRSSVVTVQQNRQSGQHQIPRMPNGA